MHISEVTEQNTVDDISPELQQLIDIAGKTGDKMAASSKYKYQLFVPRKTAVYEDFKPNAERWTSTAIKRGDTYTSEWVEWCHFNMPRWIDNTGTLYRIEPGAKNLHIGSDRRAIEIAKLFGRQYKTRNYERLGNYPWKELGLYFDAIHYPARLRRRYDNILMSSWDVESTAWYNTNKLTVIKQVQVKARGW